MSSCECLSCKKLVQREKKKSYQRERLVDVLLLPKPYRTLCYFEDACWWFSSSFITVQVSLFPCALAAAARPPYRSCTGRGRCPCPYLLRKGSWHLGGTDTILQPFPGKLRQIRKKRREREAESCNPYSVCFLGLSTVAFWKQWN